MTTASSTAQSDRRTRTVLLRASELLATPCCGYAGIAEVSSETGALLREGDAATFVDYDSSVGFSNFSGERDVGREVGVRVRSRERCRAV